MLQRKKISNNNNNGSERAFLKAALASNPKYFLQRKGLYKRQETGEEAPRVAGPAVAAAAGCSIGASPGRCPAAVGQGCYRDLRDTALS